MNVEIINLVHRSIIASPSLRMTELFLRGYVTCVKVLSDKMTLFCKMTVREGVISENDFYLTNDHNNVFYFSS